MKREDLTEWGLNDEQAEKVMAAYGKAIQAGQIAQALRAGEGDSNYRAEETAYTA